MSEDYGNPWRPRIAVAIVTIAVIMGGLYVYGRFISPAKEMERLAERLKMSDVPAERAEAARALARMKVKSVAPLLEDALSDDDEGVRIAVIGSLGELKAESAAGAIADLLKDKSARVRRSSATALGLLRSKSAVQPLIAALKDKKADVRTEAVLALARIADASALEPLEKVAKSDRDRGVKQTAKEAVEFLKTGQWPTEE